jgi:protein-tyrosine-phosphatase
MTERACHVLFLCTGNSARSILAEALLERMGAPNYRGFSAGSQPKEAPHPVAIATLEAKGFDTEGLRSKSWDEFAAPGAPVVDLVITVCDNAANESCPIWPGNPLMAHWSLEDPAAFDGGPEATRQRFEQTYDELEARIDRLAMLDMAELRRNEFARRVSLIGRLDSS